MYIIKIVLRLLTQTCFLHKFSLQLKKDSDSTKQSSRRLSKEEIKKQLIDAVVYNENIDTEI